jgi:hypothetical protein
VKENLVIREKTGQFTLRVNDVWHRLLTFREAVEVLQGEGLDAHRMLGEAIQMFEPLDIEYKPKGWGRRSWTVNGRPQPLAVVRYLLAEQGCDAEVIAVILHAQKFCYEFQQWMASCLRKKC